MPAPEQCRRLGLDAASAVAGSACSLGTVLKFAIPLADHLFAGDIIDAGTRTQTPRLYWPRHCRVPSEAVSRRTRARRDQGVIADPPPPLAPAVLAARSNRPAILLDPANPAGLTCIDTILRDKIRSCKTDLEIAKIW